MPGSVARVEGVVIAADEGFGFEFAASQAPDGSPRCKHRGDGIQDLPFSAKGGTRGYLSKRDLGRENLAGLQQRAQVGVREGANLFTRSIRA